MFYDVLTSLHQDAPQLKRLKFFNPDTGVPGFTLEDRRVHSSDGVYCYLPSLEKLSIQDEAADLLHFRVPQLTKLMPHMVGEDTRLSQLIELTPLLRHVDLHHEFKSESLTHLAAVAPYIEKLNLESIRDELTTEHLTIISSFRYLNEINLSHLLHKCPAEFVGLLSAFGSSLIVTG